MPNLWASKELEEDSYHAPEPVPDITVGGIRLDGVDQFCYLGSTVTSHVDRDAGLTSRISKAAGNFCLLQDRAWNNNKLSIKVKSRIYKTCVLSTLLYDSETWMTYAKHTRRLTSFHVRCLGKILQRRWQHRVTNVEVLNRAGMSFTGTLISKKGLRQLGHVT